MNLKMGRERSIGFALLAGTVLAAVIGLWLAWATVCRMRSVSLLLQAADQRMAGKLAEARRSARDALAWENTLQAQLAALDPDAKDAVASLERLGRSFDGGGEVLRASVALAHLRAGNVAPDLPEDGDGPWIRAAISSRTRPTLPPTDQTPSLGTLAAVLPMLTAGAAGDATVLRRVLGLCLLAAPRHPERPAITVLCLALDERKPDAARFLLGSIGDNAQRVQALTLWANLRGQPLDNAAPVVPKPPSDGPGPRLALIRALLLAKDAKGAEQVILNAPEGERPRLRLAVLEAAGDAKTAAPLLEALKPKLVGMRRLGAFASFDLVLADGSPLRLPVALVVDGLELANGKVERIGPRFIVPINQGPCRIELRCGGLKIAEAMP